MSLRSVVLACGLTYPLVGIALLLSAAPVPARAQSAADTAQKRPPLSADSARARRARLAPVRITGRGSRPVNGYLTTRSVSATKTDTPLLNVPQSVSVVTQELIRDQGMRGMADVARFVPGVAAAQGEGNRDALVIRGNSSTSDFFVDGVRDDVQFFRDLYNVDRVEALKGANAMTFGRGGVGGVINRVTRQADWGRAHEFTLQGGSWNNRRLLGDVNQALNPHAAVRVTGMLEDSDSYRSGVGVRRAGLNPTVAFAAGDRARIHFGYEYFNDQRTADRGIPSFQGRPIATDASSFFGDPRQSYAHATVRRLTATSDYEWSRSLALRTHTSYADYDKFYQNVYPGRVSAAGDTYSVSAYNDATRRRNLFHQSNLTTSVATGGIRHTLLAGLELARQLTDNVRQTGYFNNSATSATASTRTPTISIPLTFRASTTDASNIGTAQLASLYVQDQMELTPWLQVVVGLRADRFSMDIENRRTDVQLTSLDAPISPRVGLIVKPVPSASLYATYSRSYLPRAGEQLGSLSLSNAALDPESFDNREIGAKWDANGSLSITAAAYELDRTNVAVSDPTDAARLLLVDGQRTRGLELGVTGRLASAWSMVGGYSFSDGTLTHDLTTTAKAGNRLALLPRHMISLWNRWELSSQWGAGLGAMAESAEFAATDNSVTLPGYARFDAALFYSPSQHLRLQLNLENVFNAAYIASAHNNNNITPGAPRGVRLSMTVR